MEWVRSPIYLHRHVCGSWSGCRRNRWLGYFSSLYKLVNGIVWKGIFFSFFCFQKWSIMEVIFPTLLATWQCGTISLIWFLPWLALPCTSRRWATTRVIGTTPPPTSQSGTLVESVEVYSLTPSVFLYMRRARESLYVYYTVVVVATTKLIPMPFPATTNAPWWSYNVGLLHFVGKNKIK